MKGLVHSFSLYCINTEKIVAHAFTILTHQTAELAQAVVCNIMS